MEQIYTELCDHLLSKHASDPNRRILVAIAGIAGSGKTTISSELERRLNNRGVGAIAVSMDGYHLTRKELDDFDNPSEAHARRGAFWTFNPHGLLQLVRCLREQQENVIYAPSFDHAVGDPIGYDICIEPRHKIVLLEGLYLHLSKPEPWSLINTYMNENWFVDIDVMVARERVIQRHIASGLAKNNQEAAHRFDTNDLLNANYILENRIVPTRTIRSISTS
ncbi:uncharacterized protein VTP21DRAFT_8285 [Calcarisporiella thermophila]|uniref:uncharacterized protein n=1 Tax=Calcarisporiella thermophila TaxID=911321 RepID=UPI0037435F4C